MKTVFLSFIAPIILNYQFCVCMERMHLLAHEASNNCCHIPFLCCGTGHVIPGPKCCCCYKDCKTVCLGFPKATALPDEGIFPRFHYDYPGCCERKGCCCNVTRFKRGCLQNLCCLYTTVGKNSESESDVFSSKQPTRKCILNEEYEGLNLLFCLTCGCCFGACCLDHFGHIIPCAGAATCFADRCACCNCGINESHGYGVIDSFSGEGWSCGHMLCCCLSKHRYSSGQYNMCSNFPIICCATLVAAKMGCGLDPLGISSLSSRVQRVVPKP